MNVYVVFHWGGPYKLFTEEIDAILFVTEKKDIPGIRYTRMSLTEPAKEA